MTLTAELRLDVATAPRHDTLHWTRGSVTWAEVVSWLDSPADVRQAGSYVLGTLATPRRSSTSVTHRQVLTLDADDGDPTSGIDVLSDLAGIGVGAAAAHTTWSHTPSSPRWRVLVPLSRPVDASLYGALVRGLLRMLGLEMFDLSCAEHARLMYRPARPPERAEHYRTRVWDGPALDPADWLTTWAQPEDFAPAGGRPAGAPRQRQDPMTLPGAVGAFNRLATDWDDLIAEYDLPYDRHGERWAYRHAHVGSAPGVVEIAPGLLWSSHESDPAHGKARSAWDLVRVHRHGAADVRSPPGTDISRLPSHLAMLREHGSRREVVAEMAAQDFAGIVEGLSRGDDDENAPSALPSLGLLDVDPRSGRTRASTRTWDALRDDDPTLAALRQDEMTGDVVWRTPPPWRRGGTAAYAPTDDRALADHLDRLYGVAWPTAELRERVRALAAARPHHPVRAYLDSLVWDGRARLGTCPMVSDPSPAEAAALRLALVGAVARAFAPGTAVDHVLVLVGDEGVGKTKWCQALARGWSVEIERPSSVEDTRRAQTAWIALADEIAGRMTGGPAADRVKSWLTATADTIRRPYDPAPETRRRSFVVWATTNDRRFLARAQGERRFLTVQTDQHGWRVRPEEFESEWVDQLWAEAVAAWHEGERPFLTESENAEQRASRERYVTVDPDIGVIEQWLETPAPEGVYGDLVGFAEGAPSNGPRKVVCVRQVSTEALRDRRDPGVRDQIALRVLDELPGWRPDGYADFGPYGRQPAYWRVGASRVDSALLRQP